MTDKTIRMPKALLEKWLAALRSGEYRQAKGRLEENGAYCCLGVLQHCTSGEIVEAGDSYLPDAGWLIANGISFSNTGGEDRSPYLPALYESASSANDSGRTFAVIADAIEACAEGY